MNHNEKLWGQGDGSFVLCLSKTKETGEPSPCLLFGVTIMKKIIYLSCFLPFLVIILIACHKLTVTANKPCNQPHTKWMSEDGAIVFYVDDGCHTTGTINLNGKIIDFYLTDDTGLGMEIFPIDVLEKDVIDENDKYEHGLCSYKNKKSLLRQ